MRAKNSTATTNTPKPFPQSGDNFTMVSPLSNLADLEVALFLQDCEKAFQAFEKSVPVQHLEDSGE